MIITHSKNKVVTLTVIHVILVAFSQGLVSHVLICVLAHYAPLGKVLYQHAVTTTGIRALMDCPHRQLEF